MKVHVNVSIDSYLLDKAKEARINMSQTCEDAIRTQLNVIKGDLAGINIDIERKKLEREEQQLKQLQSNIIEGRAIIAKWEEAAKTATLERLEQQRKEAEKLSKCQHCGQILSEKMKKHKFPIGAICNACFMTSAQDNWKKWNSTQPLQP